LDRGALPESWAWFLTLSMGAYVLSVVVMLWIATVRFRRGRVICGRMRAYRWPDRRVTWRRPRVGADVRPAVRPDRARGSPGPYHAHSEVPRDRRCWPTCS